MVCSFVSRKETTVGRNLISVYWQIEKNAIKHKSTQWWLWRQKHVKTLHIQVPLWHTFKTIWRLRAFTFRGKVWKKTVRNLTKIWKHIHTARYTIHEMAKTLNIKTAVEVHGIVNQLVMENSNTATAKIPHHVLLVRVQTCEISFQSGENKETKCQDKTKGRSKRPCFIALYLSYETHANSDENTSG